MALKPAVRAQSKLRLAITGPSGYGKTYTALRIAKGIGPKVAVLDCEHGKAALYAPATPGAPLKPGEFTFETEAPTSFPVEACIRFIRECEEGGYDVAIIDGFSQFWQGPGGLLEQNDNTAASKGTSTFDAWRVTTPKYHKLISALLTAKVHVICTMRVKMEYVAESSSSGKIERVKKLGLAPIQRDSTEYEFDFGLDMNAEHNGTVSKSHYLALPDGQYIEKPGEALGAQIAAWLTEGVAPPAATGDLATSEMRRSIANQLEKLSTMNVDVTRTVEQIVGHHNRITVQEAAHVSDVLRQKITIKELEAKTAAMKAGAAAGKERSGSSKAAPAGGSDKPDPPAGGSAPGSPPTTTPPASTPTGASTPPTTGTDDALDAAVGPLGGWDGGSADEARAQPAAPGDPPPDPALAKRTKALTLTGLQALLARELDRLGIEEQSDRQALIWDAVGHNEPPSHADLERAVEILRARAVPTSQISESPEAHVQP